MSVRPETLALLDRVFGRDRNADDQLARIELAANDLYSLTEDLSRKVRTFLSALAADGVDLAGYGLPATLLDDAASDNLTTANDSVRQIAEALAEIDHIILRGASNA